MTDTTNLYRCTPRQTRSHIVDCLMAGLVPFVQGSPGVGKSSIVRSIFDEFGLDMIDHRLSTSAPEDLTGLPRFDENGEARFAPFADLFPLAGREKPKGSNGWGLFLDEFNSAPKSVQAAAYKLVLDRKVGQFDLHEDVGVVLAGNLSTDKAITTSLSTAMQSRLIHIEMEINFEEWREDVALAQNFDPRIIGFLSFKPSLLMDFRPDHQEKTFCCPRTWEFMNKLIKGKEVRDDKISLYAGALTSGVAVEFVQFTKIYASMVSIADIRKDPEKCPVPQDNATKWAVVSHLMDIVTEEAFEDVATYIDRFDLTFKIVFFRSVILRNEKLKRHPSFAKAMIALSRYING
jgi:hypothetical protein